MIKSDMLYQLDLRLKEIKQNTDRPFGGVSIFLFGDILQLRPVKAKYIFEEPRSESFHLTYLIDSLWEKFDVVMLMTNHRQGEDREYADVLNRIRVGEVQEEDIKLLERRVKPVNDPDIPFEALVVSCINEGVNQINEKKLNLIEGDEHLVQAVTNTATKRNIKPMTDASGAIRNTPLQKTLKLKVGARVMLTFNIDTCDCLTNGTFGEIIGLEFDTFNKLSRVIIEFDTESSGKEKRKNHTDLQRKYYPRLATPIEKIEFNYSLSKKPTSSASNAVALQFPLRLSFAATAHKVQGATIKKRNKLVVDLRTVPGRLPTRHFPTRHFPTRHSPTGLLPTKTFTYFGHLPTETLSYQDIYLPRPLPTKDTYLPRHLTTSDISLPRRFPTKTFSYQDFYLLQTLSYQDFCLLQTLPYQDFYLPHTFYYQDIYLPRPFHTLDTFLPVLFLLGVLPTSDTFLLELFPFQLFS